jgi:hypothetical protein
LKSKVFNKVMNGEEVVEHESDLEELDEIVFSLKSKKFLVER